MYLVKTPLLISKFAGKSLIWKIPTKEKKLYLTFDDGPIPDLTPKILDILNEYRAYATFFCVGENAYLYPELLNNIRSQGHILGNHSYHHLNGWKTFLKEYIEDINKSNQILKSSLFRPPYGQITYSQIKELKKEYKIIMWSILSGDFDTNLSPEECLFNVLQSKAGDIVVFHDNKKSEEKLLFALPRFLDHFTSKGYSFHHLGELIND
jgi:peptidoglycan/xylan/chitin deacetylase (PgdA/CDA1 family)